MDTAVDDRVTYIIITIIKSITVDVCVGFVFLTAHGQQGLVHLKQWIDFKLYKDKICRHLFLTSKPKVKPAVSVGSEARVV